jgi:hypothetical protein
MGVAGVALEVGQRRADPMTRGRVVEVVSLDEARGRVVVVRVGENAAGRAWPLRVMPTARVKCWPLVELA